jgi:hypothetical protein
MSTQQTLAGLGHSNTPKLFKYVLQSTDYGTEVLTNVPVGWDGSELTFIRDPKYKGVLQEFSTNELRFVKEGRDYILTAYEAKGIDYEITINIYLQNNSTFAYESYFVGKIDLSSYRIDSTAVTVKIIATGFQNTILNRDKLKVDLLNTKFIGGGEGSMESIAFAPNEFTLTQYSATQNASWLMNDEATEKTSYSHYVPLDVQSTEYPLGAAQSQSFDDTTPFFTSDTSHSVDVTGNIKGELISNAGVQNLRLVVTLRKNGVIQQTYDTGIQNAEEYEFDFPVSKSLSLVVSDTVSLRGVLTGTDVDIAYFDGSINFSEDLGSTLPQIQVESYQAYEFVTRVISLISGNSNPLYSELLGRTDSKPNPVYATDGDGSLMHFTKGQWIRKFPISQLEADGTTTILQTINASLEDTFKTLNGLHNIGLGFEVISGDNKVRIEKEAYFFDITDNPNYPATETEAYLVNQILDFSSVLTGEVIEKEVLPDWYANEAESGYSKFEYENVQGLKEFNTKTGYATPIKAVKSKLDLTCPFRSDTQGINKLREKQYADDPTEDVKGDNDIFLFDVKRASDWTVKTDEDFDLVTGGVDPGQSYNLSYTPRRNFEKHGNRFRSMRLALGDEIQFLETDKNSKLVTQKTGETTTKAENGDIVVEDLTKGYWIPEAYIFEAPVNEATISAIQANPYGVIKLSSTQYGWILEVQSNNQNNKGQFKLLRVDLDNVKIVT